LGGNGLAEGKITAGLIKKLAAISISICVVLIKREKNDTGKKTVVVTLQIAFVALGT